MVPDLDNFTFLGFTIIVSFIGLIVREIVSIFLEEFDWRIPAGKFNGDISKNKDINLPLPTESHSSRSSSSSNQSSNSSGASASSVPSRFSANINDPADMGSGSRQFRINGVERPSQCNPENYMITTVRGGDLN